LLKMRSLVLLAFVGLAQIVLCNVYGDKISVSESEKAKLMDEMIDADFQEQIEKMIDTLDADELDALEEILSKPLDEETELKMIQAELEELGMDPQDIEDMFDLADMMKEFLNKIPDVEGKLELQEDEYTLEDHCKLYLLGLPNKLGPMGFLALHSILESAGEAVSVEIGDFEPAEDTDGEVEVEDAKEEEASLTPLGDLFTRKRREIEEKAEMNKAAEMAKLAAMEKVAMMEKAAEMEKAAIDKAEAMAKSAEPQDIVSEILARRRRAMGERK